MNFFQMKRFVRISEQVFKNKMGLFYLKWSGFTYLVDAEFDENELTLTITKKFASGKRFEWQGMLYYL